MHLDHSSDCEEDFIQCGLYNGGISSGELGGSLIIDKKSRSNNSISSLTVLLISFQSRIP